MRQKDRCIYCQRQFGDTNVRRGVSITLRLTWDHFIPYAYTMTHTDDNWVASCQICNAIKHDKMYPSVEYARVRIHERRMSKGYLY
jgi:5-methylcytosine-specific restriction endonuclease McrA